MEGTTLVTKTRNSKDTCCLIIAENKCTGNTMLIMIRRLATENIQCKYENGFFISAL